VKSVKWRRWTADTQHPWVTKCEKEEGAPFGEYSFESRLFSPDGKLWPLVNFSTRVFVSEKRKEDLKNGVLHGVPNGLPRAFAPGVQIDVSMKIGASDWWESNLVGIPTSLLPEALDMLKRAAGSTTQKKRRA
jgi:hypothetical protein